MNKHVREDMALEFAAGHSRKHIVFWSPYGCFVRLDRYGMRTELR